MPQIENDDIENEGGCIWNTLFQEIDEKFEDFEMPFTVSCIDKIEDLDAKFSDEPVIIIRDNRNESFVFDNLDDEERGELLNFTVIFKKENKPFIDLEDVIVGMCGDAHYFNELILQDNHIFLEGFDQDSKIQYTASFGS
jgi:hypothetical protein